MQYISILSTIITFVFAIAVFRRYRQRKGIHLLLWGLGLVFYGLGTFSEAILAFVFSPIALKVWYITGAMLTAAWLGQGTVHLLVRRPRVALTLTGILAIVSVIAALLVLSAPIDPAAAAAYNVNAPASAQYDDILVRSGGITLLTILLNVYGTVTLVGGAIYSAYIFWRKHVLVDRMIGNILIAAGALFPAMGGSFLRAGLVDWLYLSELFGVILMYIGFIKATSYRPLVEPQGMASASTD
jgi:hypothetical protein